MNTLFKLITLPAMRVASFHVRDSETPEEIARAELMRWAEPRGVFDHPFVHQVFGRNHPMPVNNPVRRGYEFLLSLADDTDTTGVPTRELAGGLYVVVQSRGLQQMQAHHASIMQWISDSTDYTYGYPEDYDYAHLPSLELEHHIDPLARVPLIDYYFPIRRLAG